MSRAWLLGAATLLALVALAGAAEAQAATSSSGLSRTLFDLPCCGTSVGATLTVTVTNPTAENLTVNVAPTATGTGHSFSGSQSFTLAAGQSSARQFSMSVAASGGTSTGARSGTAFVNVTNESGATSTAHSTFSFTVTKPNEMRLHLPVAHRTGFGAGSQQSIVVNGYDPYNGWESTSVSSIPTPTCTPDITNWGPTVSRSTSTISSSSNSTLATLYFYPPSGLNADAASPLGTAWRHTSVSCTVTVNHNGDNPAATATFTLNPFFAGVLAHPSGTDVVVMTKNVDAGREVEVQYKNRMPFTVTVSAQAYSGSPYVSVTSRSLQVAPGATSQLRVPVVIDDTATEGSQSLTLAVEVRDLQGSTIETGYPFTSFTVVKPAEMTLQADPHAPVFPAQGGSIPLRAGEKHAWKDVAIDATASTVHCPDVVAWTPTLQLNRAIVSAGSAESSIGSVTFSVPADLDAKTWRHKSAACTVTLVYRALGSGTTQSVQASPRIDPTIPATLSITFPAQETPFVFDRPRADRTPYEKPVQATLANWGEVDFQGNLSLARAGADCTMTWRTGGPALVRADAAATPASTTLVGNLSVTSTHPEGACAATPIRAANSSAPLLASQPTLAPPYRVTHGARIVATASVDLGEVPIGELRVRQVHLHETLGYQPILVRASVQATSALVPENVVPAFDAEVLVDANENATVNLTFQPPAGSPPCSVGWTITWKPASSRPGLADAYTTSVQAQTRYTGIETQLARLETLRLEDESAVRSLLSRLDSEGCALTPEEIGAAQRVLVALPALGAIHSGGNATGSDLVVGATTLQDVRKFITPGEPDRHPALRALDAPYAAARERLSQELAQKATSTQGVKELSQLLLVADELELDNASIYAARQASLDGESRRNAEALDSLNQLFGVPGRAPAGFELAQGVSVNPNPFGWVALDRVRAQAAEDATQARASFAEHGPLVQRVNAAQAEADVAIASAKRALVLGAVVDAALAAALTVFVVRAVGRYARDVEEVAVGREFGA